MKKSILLIIFAGSISFNTTIAHANLYIEGIGYYEIVPNIMQPHSESNELTSKNIQFSAMGKTFSLLLTPNEFINDLEITWVGDSAQPYDVNAEKYYKGTVVGEDNSWARLTIADGMITGLIRSEGELYVMESASDYIANENGMIFYRMLDSIVDMPGICAVEGDKPTIALHQLSRKLDVNINLNQLAHSGPIEDSLRLGLMMDFEFFQQHGRKSAAIAQDIMNQVDGIYKENLGVSLHVNKIAVYTNAQDPFSDTTHSLSLLDELKNVVNGDENPIPNVDLTHLLTGKKMDADTTIGIATTTTLCNSERVGISSDLTSSKKSMILLTAHEIGHTLGAPHDYSSRSRCASAASGFIMNPFASVNMNFRFSQCSINNMYESMQTTACNKRKEFDGKISALASNVEEPQDPDPSLVLVKLFETYLEIIKEIFNGIVAIIKAMGEVAANTPPKS